MVSDGSPSADGTGRYSLVVRGITAAPPYPPSVFWPSERPSDPLLLDVAAPAGLVLPNDVTLVGRTFTVQGACGGFGRSFRLSNALTQTIGG